MRLLAPLLAILPTLAIVLADASSDAQTTFEYQSDVSRLRSIVVNSLYGSKSIFLRELISNANDALEKLRITSLKDQHVTIGLGELNVTIRAEPDKSESGGVGRLIIHDTGIGMTPEELQRNLGTIAKSGTSEFLSSAEDSNGKPDGNLIGQFGLGFYSTFLIASSVRVSSLPPPTASNPHPVQHIFESDADGTSFKVYEDPRGNTLGERGTEIVMVLREGEGEWLEENKIREIVETHSSFATSFPIYLQTTRTITRPLSPLQSPKSTSKLADDAASIEDVLPDDEPQTEEVEEVAFEQLNTAEPIWVRDPKTIEDQEYDAFYRALSKDTEGPLAWSHFKADFAGINFKSIIFVPSALSQDFWTKAEQGVKNVRMMVKRVFITDDLGDHFIPRWLSFLKVVVDADDLPLTVSRDTLTNSKFINQLQRHLIKKALDMFTKLSTSDPEKYKKLFGLVGNALKAGVTETYTDRVRLAKLLRFDSNLNEFTSLEDYASRRRAGQKQIYFLAGVGQPTSDLARSPFVEKLHARGYEVLLLNEPMDEICLSQLRNYESLTFQDVTKKGLKFGDEDLDDEDEKESQVEIKERFTPLSDFIKKTFGKVISDVIISQRLVTSPTAIVSDDAGMSANMIRLMASQAQGDEDPMLKFMRSQPRVLEINPHSPLIQGLLEEAVGAEGDSKAQAELKETVGTLLDLTMVRSGFTVPDMHLFFSRVEALLRRSIGVSPSAKTETPEIKPAPEVEQTPLGSEPESASGVSEQDELEQLLRSMGGAGSSEMPSFEEFDRQKLEDLANERKQGAAHDEL
ncbi:Endoplasmic reticulum glucose-regulated protein (GRP94/endoplasmin), HSP90 family [Phaffia rhodozyma]|uniref:Endoplasmic reticulum glucose-regulated protein (GRP94/endoplasmin), HSP90 family n=1 Tax=Phaffia rhodozyma TaxID=264483 RepID=A0A0F7SQF2_PHARH|nr:Endoplasmic reticulum glucose-regulated protein (GRP94/endoplasmin), HSP90 family [Phaffia rhodozyma]